MKTRLAAMVLAITALVGAAPASEATTCIHEVCVTVVDETVQMVKGAFSDAGRNVCTPDVWVGYNIRVLYEWCPFA